MLFRSGATEEGLTSRGGRNLRLPLRFRLRPQGPCRVGTGAVRSAAAAKTADGGQEAPSGSRGPLGCYAGRHVGARGTRGPGETFVKGKIVLKRLELGKRVAIVEELGDCQGCEVLGIRT